MRSCGMYCNRSTIKLLLTLPLILLPTISFFLSNYWESALLIPKSKLSGSKQCNIFRGKWIPNPAGPYYTNETCKEFIDLDKQNCMKFGRTDTEFLKWRWKPSNCELPLFNALEFLELVRGKSMAFVGDSLARNHVQSLMCLLTAVATPLHVSSSKDQINRYWSYLEYNFTVALFWSPYLVKAPNADPKLGTYPPPMDVYLDRPNEAWSSRIETFNYVVISAARWFFRTQMYFERGKIVGCFNCPHSSLKKFTMFHGYKKALRTMFRTLLGLKNFKGVTFLRGLSPVHFENGEWDNGGNCPSTRPVVDGRGKNLSSYEQELYAIQKEEFRRVEKQGKKRGLKFKLIDATHAMLARPDGHPHFYWPRKNASIADCLHWCLPGPVDTWNEFLLHMLKDLGDGTYPNNHGVKLSKVPGMRFKPT